MQPLPLLGVILLALPASAHQRGDGPSKEPKKEPTPIERACREKKVRITLADAPPAEPAEPGDEDPAPKPSLKEEADQAAAKLGGGKVRYWTDDQGQRTLRWSRGKKSPEQCVESLNALALRFPGRLLITDPRYGRSAEKIKVGSDVAAAEVAKVEKALPKAEIRNSPGFFESFFDGGNTALAAHGAPGLRSGTGPAGYRDPSGDPSSAQAFWAEEAQRNANGLDWRYNTGLPRSFNPNSAAPPQPGGLLSSEPWWSRTGRAAARGIDQTMMATSYYAGTLATGVKTFGQQALDWVGENLIKAPLASFSRISSTFGSRYHPIKKTWRHHSGVDYAAKTGEAVMAMGPGTVVSAGWNGGYGNAIVIRHASGTETLYGHLSRVGVRAGQTVTAGRVIGNVGSTGQSTGPHLHYEVRRGGRAVDPLKVASL